MKTGILRARERVKLFVAAIHAVAEKIEDRLFHRPLIWIIRSVLRLCGLGAYIGAKEPPVRHPRWFMFVTVISAIGLALFMAGVIIGGFLVGVSLLLMPFGIVIGVGIVLYGVFLLLFAARAWPLPESPSNHQSA